MSKTGTIFGSSSSELVQQMFCSANMSDVIMPFYYLPLELYYSLNLLQIQLYKSVSGLPWHLVWWRTMLCFESFSSSKALDTRTLFCLRPPQRNSLNALNNASSNLPKPTETKANRTSESTLHRNSSPRYCYLLDPSIIKASSYIF